MTDPGIERRVFATGTTHEGRSVPPDGWGLETTPGIAGRGADLPFVQVAGGALLPSVFVMQLTLPVPSGATIRLVYKAHQDGVAVTTVFAQGMDAIQAIDALRRVAPIEVWNRVAVSDLVRRLAMMQLAATGDGVRVLTSLGMSEENAKKVIAAFGAEGGTWPTFQPGAGPAVPIGSAEWASAVDAWREHLESGGLTTVVHGTPTRPIVRRNRVTREHLAAVAAVYRKAQDAGEPPTLAVAQAFQASHSTATRWVGQARKAKLLGAARKGRVGEFTDDKGADEES